MKKINFLLCTIYLQYLLFLLTLLALIRLIPILFSKWMASPDILRSFPFSSWSGTKDDYDRATAFFDISSALLLLSICAYLALLALCFISLAADYKNNDAETLFQKMKRVKFGLAPFWAINIILLVSLCAGNGFLDSIALRHEVWRHLSICSDIAKHFFFAEIGLLYIHLVLASRFSLAYLKLLRKNGLIDKKQFAKHSVLQLFFIADIFGTIALAKKHGNLGIPHGAPVHAPGD